MASISQTGPPLLGQLSEAVAGPVIGPDDQAYDEARRVFSPAIDRRPSVVVRPRDADDVAAVVSLAQESGTELAVRGGGHSQAGHGVSDGGIVLDLSLLKGLEIDAERRTAAAGAGLTAGEVTLAAATNGLAVGFGDTGSVGIGGLTLGGGVGYLVRKHGLTIDSLLAAELVTAGGRVLRVDAERHPDLFWAIRGGGGNFGVVTRFEYRLHPVDTVTGGMLVLPATPETIAAFVEAADEAPDDVSTIATVMPARPLPFVPEAERGRPVLTAMLLHAGPVEEAEPALAPFRTVAVPIADFVRPMSYPEIFPPANGDHGPLGSARTMFLDAVDRSVAGEILECLRGSDAQLAAAQVRVLGGAMARVPADATAFAHRGSGIMANVAAMYATPDEAPRHEAWLTDTVAALQQEDGGAYVNFLGDEGEERVRAAYPQPTWNRLAAIKRRHDPENLFRLNQNVSPA